MAVKLTTYLHQVWNFGVSETVHLFIFLHPLVLNYVQVQIDLK